METVRVQIPDKSYDICIGNDIFHLFPERFKQTNPGKKVAIITNPTVSKLYSGKLLGILDAHDINPLLIEIPDGEKYKSQKWAFHIIDRLLEEGFDRRSSLIALGGGVIGDITGYVAATFLRGVAYIQFPTTLISQVDSSVGGKTGINHPRGKNLIGAFHQPKLVFIDTAILKTLEMREITGGMAEVIKYGIIYDRSFFSFLEKNREEILALEPGITAKMIKRCCEIKADIVAKDEKEVSGLRAILNYGHTIGHAIESLTAYNKYRHGEAISIGMIYAARLAVQLEVCTKEESRMQEDIIKHFSLPTQIPALDTDQLINTIRLDKKTEDGKIKFILCKKIGGVVSRTILPEELETLFSSQAEKLNHTGNQTE